MSQGEAAKAVEGKLAKKVKAPSIVGLEGLKVMAEGVLPQREEDAATPKAPAPKVVYTPPEHNPDIQKLSGRVLAMETAVTHAHAREDISVKRILDIEKALGEPSPAELELKRLEGRMSTLEKRKSGTRVTGGVKGAHVVGFVGGATAGALGWQLGGRIINALWADTVGLGWLPTLITAGVGATVGTGLGEMASLAEDMGEALLEMQKAQG